MKDLYESILDDEDAEREMHQNFSPHVENDGLVHVVEYNDFESNNKDMKNVMKYIVD